MAHVGPQRHRKKKHNYVIFIAYVIRRNVPSIVLEHQQNPFHRTQTAQKLERKPTTGKLSVYAKSDVS